MRYNAVFSPAEVTEIRAQYREGVLDVRAWAISRNVSLETIRRVARGDTYRNIEAMGYPSVITRRPLAQPTPLPQRERSPLEPSPEELEASLHRLARAVAAPAAEAREVDTTLAELLAAGRQARPTEGQP